MHCFISEKAQSNHKIKVLYPVEEIILDDAWIRNKTSNPFVFLRILFSKTVHLLSLCLGARKTVPLKFSILLIWVC